jgi:hypothetical protein
MPEAVRQVAAVQAKVAKDGSSSTTAQDVFDVVRGALTKLGISVRVTAGPAEYHRQKSLFVSTVVTVDYCAPDGSYDSCTLPGGATAPNLKSCQAAITAAVKSIHRHTFLLQVVDPGTPPTTRISPQLRAHIAFLQTVDTIEGLRTANRHPTALALHEDDWASADVNWHDRKNRLIELEGMDKRAWDSARRQAAESDQAKRQALKDSKRPRKAPIDLSDTEPLTEKPSKRKR